MNNNKQKVLISIDTEGPAGSDPVTSLIYGKTESGREYGIRYLMRLFNKYNAKGLFFVDFAEAWDYGEDKISGVVKCIEEQGHNVGVHLHPDHMADRERKYLWQYSYSEQYEMISKCTSLYEKVLKKKPISFRTGRYGANNDTIRILDKIGYKYDMSEFYGNKYCRINPPICCNKIGRMNGLKLFEVPVTSFKSFSSPVYSRFDKVDCTMNSHEFDRVMKRICNSEIVDVVSLFVHSFSVLKWRKDPDAPNISKKFLKRLEYQLDWVYSHDEIIYISESDLEKYAAEEKSTDTILDLSKGLSSYWFFAELVASVLYSKMIRNI